MPRFLLNRTEIATDAPEGSSLVDFLRNHQRLYGTKIGCREGDCGACTVLVGERANGRLRYRTMASCLTPLGNVAGKHVVTIESVSFEVPDRHTRFSFEKTSKRAHLDMATVNSALRVVLEAGLIRRASFAVGSLGPTVLHLGATSSFLAGKPLDNATFIEANRIAQGEIALVLARTEDLALRARKKIKVDIEALPPLVTARDAFQAGSLLCPSRTFERGDPEAAWARSAHLVEGRADMGGQEHLYLETQATYACPAEHDGVTLRTSTQATRYVQRGVARVLGIPMHRIEVDTNRLGGGFGGKEDQATPWACLAALGAYLLKRPVKLVLSRADDMVMTGKRHPYSFDFKLGLDRDLKILGYQLVAYQDGGACADVSPAVMERTLFHGTGCYAIPSARITCHSCRTHLPPNTAFRGFGAPQAMFALEAAIVRPRPPWAWTRPRSSAGTWSRKATPSPTARPPRTAGPASAGKPPRTGSPSRR